MTGRFPPDHFCRCRLQSASIKITSKDSTHTNSRAPWLIFFFSFRERSWAVVPLQVESRPCHIQKYLALFPQEVPVVCVARDRSMSSKNGYVCMIRFTRDPGGTLHGSTIWVEGKWWGSYHGEVCFGTCTTGTRSFGIQRRGANGVP